jgi:hypothetical protein
VHGWGNPSSRSLRQLRSMQDTPHPSRHMPLCPYWSPGSKDAREARGGHARERESLAFPVCVRFAIIERRRHS